MEKSTSSKKNTQSSAGKTAKRSNTKTNGKSSMQSESSMLMDFFTDELKDIYWAEKHLTKALPKLQRAANSEELQQAFQEHTEVTNEHVSRLEQVFEMLGKKAQAKKCEAMEGITKEAQTIMEETEKGTATRDAALIMAAQKAEHYEIATYGGLVQLAKTMGRTDIADLLYTTLEEEKETDQKLTDIAENSINFQAMEEPSEKGMEEE
jgi:ferritin-like metal-binding protein YciE